MLGHLVVLEIGETAWLKDPASCLRAGVVHHLYVNVNLTLIAVNPFITFT